MLAGCRWCACAGRLAEGARLGARADCRTPRARLPATAVGAVPTQEAPVPAELHNSDGLPKPDAYAN